MHGIPAVHRFLSDERIRGYEPLIGRENIKRAVSSVLQNVRMCGASSFSFESLVETVLPELERVAAEGLCEVINGTGVILHTNLGRAPLASQALEAARALGSGYTNLEYDVTQGERGSRYARVSHLLREITGAQASLVVNNCAAAVLLILDTFAKNREVVVARNHLIEIGGGFRLPDVFERSGARLIEVGATNKVYVEDYERALTAQTALLFRSHLSNFRMSGFTHDVEPAELAVLGKRAGIPVVEDLGSGALLDLATYGIQTERTVQAAVRDGMDVVAFSGDKLLGGPQAGIIVGTSAHIARLANNPLIRALRVDKITLALLAETLRLYRSPETLAQIPFYRMLSAPLAALRERAAGYCAVLPRASALDCRSTVGGGALPQSELASIGVAVQDRTGVLAAALRHRRPAILARNDAGSLILDLRTIAPHQDGQVIAALKAHS
ncbi:MAG: L-seryl-tRNA(Sec) selenium transferase [Candidatus Eremiobacteraeota bacterium]|nr:L-seryl-tRNA(Sec) selenium transferase [Candidatus Eremiobacteraeota bacterium]